MVFSCREEVLHEVRKRALYVHDAEEQALVDWLWFDVINLAQRDINQLKIECSKGGKLLDKL